MAAIPPTGEGWMDQTRVVVVEHGGSRGSGYVIGPRLVLTSAHVTPERDGAVSFFQPGKAQSWRATVVWRGTPRGRDDAALLRVDDPLWVPPLGASDRWGRLVTDRPATPGETWGIPEVVQRSGRAVETLQPWGTVSPGDRYVGNRYVLSLSRHYANSAGDGGSPWAGMSGAALFCRGLLAGVITCDPADRGHAHLEAVPAWVLLRDAAFRSVLAEYGPETGVMLEPVEWHELAEPPEPAAQELLASPVALLRARRRVAPFRGRTAVLGDLRAFCEDAGFGARLLHGPGGQGKTRLAQHLADVLTAEGWTTLWLRADADGGSLAALAAAAVPLLIVVDYAETRTAQVTALLEAAARSRGGKPFKLILLARTAGDWWQTLLTATPVAEELLDGAATVRLPALEAEPGASRAEAYREAVRSYAGQLPRVRGWQDRDWSGLAARLTAGGADPDGRPSVLDGPGMGSALTLHMTALADLLDAAGQMRAEGLGDAAPAADGRGVEDRLLAHERRYWTNAATARGLHPNLTMATLTDALAAVFSLGAETHQQGEELLRGVPGLADQPVDRLGAVLGWIAALYPPAPGLPWGGPQPDRLAERFLGRHLLDSSRLVDRVVPGATDRQAVHLLTVYTRAAAHPVFDRQLDQPLTALCVRHAAVLAGPAVDVATRTEAPGPLLEALAQITDSSRTTVADLERLARRLPASSYSLGSWSVHLGRRVADHHRTRSHSDPEAWPGLAAVLHDLAGRLEREGRWHEALAALREAVEIRRSLVAERPDTFLPGLSSSLNNLSVLLSHHGQTEEALTVSGEALDIQRKVAARQPDDIVLCHLATSLANHGGEMAARRHWEKGLAEIGEAVNIYRELAAKRPDRFRGNLAGGLNNLAAVLQRRSRWSKALEAISEAVDIFRELVGTRPDAFRHELAVCLANVSGIQAQLGRPEEALAAAREAVAMYRRLAAAQSDAHSPGLASSLTNLSGALADFGRWDEALAAAGEAVEIERELVTALPAARPGLAQCLHNLSVCLSASGRQDEALAAISEAVHLYIELVRERPGAFTHELNRSIKFSVLLRARAGDGGEF
ncbi:tetratricopeptide repeat protein [Streptomyces sp. NPDC005930]|uniref:tetratricopeptide repeat protein n=1 Tax=Streptomyces sp. NPDC005930 TaxID=3364736 RepID=UPI0036A6F109